MNASGFCQPTNFPDGRQRPSWRLSGKRKFDIVCDESQCGVRASFHGSCRDAPLQREYKGSDKTDSDKMNALDGGANFQHSNYRHTGSLAENASVLCVPIPSHKSSNGMSFYGSEESNAMCQNSVLQGRNPAVNHGQSSLSQGDLRDVLFTDIQGKDSSDIMVSKTFSRKKKVESKKGLKEGIKRSSDSMKQNNRLTYSSNSEIIAIRKALKSEKDALRCLYTELEKERNASSSAANEAMAMIARLQEEKAAVLLEARQFKRMAEEREIHNEEAIALLRQMLVNKEEEITVLQNEVAACRQMFFKIETQGLGKGCDKVKLLDEGVILGNKRADSPHCLEGLERDKSSHCDGRHYSGTTIFSGKRPKSEFINREGWKSFKGLVDDTVRSNLVNLFDQARDMLEDSRACNTGDATGEHLKCSDSTSASNTCAKKVVLKLAPNRTGDGICSMGEEIGCVNVHSIEKTCGDILLEEQNLKVSTSLKNVATTPHSFGKSMLGDRVGPSEFVGEDSTSSLWERIMKLEHRLDTFGMSGPCQEDAISMLPRTGLHEGELRFKEVNQETDAICKDTISQEEHFSHEKMMSMAGSLEGAIKNLSREGPQYGTIGTSATQESLSQDFNSDKRNCYHDALGLHVNCTISFAASEQPCNNSAIDTVEGVRDVYEVQHKHNQRSLRQCLQPPINDYSTVNQVDKDSGKTDLPHYVAVQCLEACELKKEMAAILEVEGHQGPICTGSSIKTMPEGVMVARDDSGSLQGEEVQLLTWRLQALEAERLVMNQAILSLKKENKELKLLQEIAQQLRDLKRTVNASEQPSSLSFFKGLLSFLPCCLHSQGSNLPFSYQKNIDFGGTRDHAGLCYLLEKSSDSKAVVRGVNLNLPVARGRDHFSQIPFLPEPSVCVT